LLNEESFIGNNYNKMQANAKSKRIYLKKQKSKDDCNSRFEKSRFSVVFLSEHNYHIRPASL